VDGDHPLSQHFPPSQAQLPRDRAEVVRDFQQSALSVGDRLIVELLLDLREMIAECAWRLSEIEANTRHEG